MTVRSLIYSIYERRLAGIVEYKGLVLSHSPLHESQLSRWYMNVHGHLHTKRVMKYDEGNRWDVPDPRYVNVSCEQLDLTPVPFDWILNKWAEAN